MDAMSWIMVAIGSAAAYGIVILAGYWVFQIAYRCK
jgi:hypothetical protein